MDAQQRVIHGDLLIRDGRIAAIGELDREQTDGLPEQDLGHMLVIPGFVQTHIHLCQTLMRNCADDMVLIDWLRTRIWPYEASLDEEAIAMSARVGLAELLLGGTTTILDMGTVNHTDVVATQVEASGMRAHIGKCMMDTGEGVPAPMMEDRQASLRESLRLHQAWHGKDEGRIRYAFAPRFAVSCSQGMLRDVAEAAADLGVFIHTHASETVFENEHAQAHHGMSNMAYLEHVGICGARTVLAHGVHVDDCDCTMLARTRTAIAHCPSSNLKLASGIANIPRYDQHGVKVSLGADGAPCSNNLDALMELRLAALLQKPLHGPTAMPAERALRLATLDGAIALGMEDEIGSLEVGKKADLVALDLDDDPSCGPGGTVYSRIVYSARRHNVREVFIGGERRVGGGILHGEDLGQLMASARVQLGRVTERMQRYLPS